VSTRRGRWLALALGLPVAAQSPAPPSFGTGTEIVAVDVGVLDRDGRPVTGLAAADFALTVDGKPRALLSAEFVGFDERAVPARAPAGPEPVWSNAAVRPGRLVLVAVDTGSLPMGEGRAFVGSVEKLLDGLGPSDRVGLVTYPPPGPSVELTGDLARVREALLKVTGRSRLVVRRVSVTEALIYADRDDDQRWQDVLERECPADASTRGQDRDMCIEQVQTEAFQLATTARQLAAQGISMLRSVFDLLGKLEGDKTVVLLTGGMPQVESGDIRDLAQRATRGRVKLYVVQVPNRAIDVSRARPDEDFEDRALSEMSLGSLAVLSRGTLLRPGASGDVVFERVARELSGHYLLGFEPLDADRDGREHEVRVKVSRPGLTVRTRRRVLVPSQAEPRAARDLLASALASPFELGELPLRAAAFAWPPGENRQARVLVAAEAGATEELGESLLGVALVDAQGRVEGSAAAPLAAGGRGAVVLQAPPGRYTLRVAAVDARGRRARLDRTWELAAPSTARIQASDLLLVPADREGAGLRPLLEGDLARRPALAYVELQSHAVQEIEAAQIRLELAAGPDQPALVSEAVQPQRLDAQRAAVQAFVLGDLLPPGRYVARLVVTPSGSGSRPWAVQRAVDVSLPDTPEEAARRQKALRPPAEFAAALVPAFRREQALVPELVQAALEQLQALEPAPAPAVQHAAQRARAGDWTGLRSALGSEGQAGLGATFLRGLGLYAAGDVRAAQTQWRAATRLSTDFFPLPLYLGACLAAQGQDAEAAGAWQTALAVEALRLRPLHLLLADALLRSGQAEPARDVLEEALRSWPADADFEARLGLALALQGERARALDLLGRAAAAPGSDPRLLWGVLRLRFAAHLARGAESDPAALERDARAYLAAGGAQRTLVERWLQYLSAP